MLLYYIKIHSYNYIVFTFIRAIFWEHNEILLYYLTFLKRIMISFSLPAHFEKKRKHQHK